MSYLKKTDHILFTAGAFRVLLLNFTSFSRFHGLSPSNKKNVSHLNTNILCSLYSRNPKTVKYVTETVSYLAPKICFLVPNAVKISKSLDIFKFKERQWEPYCLCHLCINYLQHVGLI